MNTPPPLPRCPACQTDIPAAAPQGLCPKCLLLGVASVAGSFANSGNSAGAAKSSANPSPARGNVAGSHKPIQPPTIEELAPAFPQLEILELIGRGGMGFVYKARQTKLDRLVALKILPGHLANQPSFHERFEREARVLAKLQHPLIVGVYDFGEAVAVRATDKLPGAPSIVPPHEHSIEGSTPGANPPPATFYYLVLEFVDGVNLREAMRAGQFTPEQALAIVPQVCEALQYAHSKGVLHRDIKPENILLDTDGRVKIADFGIAKVLDPEIDSQIDVAAMGHASESELAVTRLTATGAVLGTPLYMAPEQIIRPNTVDHRADIFSLGVVFYEMLTGELPMGRFAPPSEKSLVDQRIDEVVMRALAKERELRQQSAGEMKTEVESIVSHPQESRNPSAAEATVKKGSSGHVALAQPVSSMMRPTQLWWALRLFWLIAIFGSVPAGMMIAYLAMSYSPSSARRHVSMPDRPTDHPVSVDTRLIDVERVEETAIPDQSEIAQQPETESAVSIEAKRLGLIKVASFIRNAHGEHPIELVGTEKRVFVDSYFWMLAPLRVSRSLVEWSVMPGNKQGETVNYPCDYVACDRSQGGPNAIISGYMKSPGAYDFRLDEGAAASTSPFSATARSEIGSVVLRLLADSAVRAESTQFDWQKAMQANHLRFRFVPKSISRLDVPDECLVDLTEGSHTIFSREGTHFTRHELTSAEGIDAIRGRMQATAASIVKPASTEDISITRAKEVIESSHRAVRQQNWEELLSNMTEDCRDDLIMEILQSCRAFIAAEQKGDEAPVSDQDPTVISARKTLTEMFAVLKDDCGIETPPLVEKRLELRQQRLGDLSDIERRQLRIDIFRANYDKPKDVAITVLTYLQQLNSSQLLLDLSTIGDLRLSPDTQNPGAQVVMGTLTLKNGIRTPVVLELVNDGGNPGRDEWLFRSLTGANQSESPIDVLSTLGGAF